MKYAMYILAVVGMVCLTGCSDFQGGGSKEAIASSEPFAEPSLATDEYTSRLADKAKELAAKELARMSAAELTYRNSVRLHAPNFAEMAPDIGVYLKIYRSFTGFEIEDIYRSESYLYPVAFQIRYDYDLLATPQRKSFVQGSDDQAKADTQFGLLGRHSVTRRYKVDKDGNYIGNLPELLPLVDFYTRHRPLDEPGQAMRNNMPPGGFNSMPGSAIPPVLPNLPPAQGGVFPSTPKQVP